MSETTRKIPIPKSLTEGQLQPQPEMLAVKPKHGHMTIGIPKAEVMQESRVALVPSAVTALTDMGFNVLMEAGAGEKANYSDHRYSEAGAEICHSREKLFQSNVLLMVAPPTMEEAAMLNPNQFVISPLHIPTITSDFVKKLQEKRVIALAMEYIKTPLRVNAIAPGGTATALSKNFTIPPDVDFELMGRYTGFREMAPPEEVTPLTKLFDWLTVVALDTFASSGLQSLRERVADQL